MNLFGIELPGRPTRLGKWLWLVCALSCCPILRAADDPEATNLWTYDFKSNVPGDGTLSTPAIGPDGTIYVGAFDGKLHAISPSGRKRWYFQSGREIKSSPAVAD